MNAPEAGIIKQAFFSEEDTVTVGADLLVLETGGVAAEKPAPAAETPSSAPATPAAPAAPAAESKPEPPKAETKPEPPKPAAPAPPKSTPAPKAATPEADSDAPVFGSREERRVCYFPTLSGCHIYAC